MDLPFQSFIIIRIIIIIIYLRFAYSISCHKTKTCPKLVQKNGGNKKLINSNISKFQIKLREKWLSSVLIVETIQDRTMSKSLFPNFFDFFD